jgi:hypothetical protein
MVVEIKKYYGNRNHALQFLKITYKNQDVLVHMKKLEETTFMINLQIKEKLKPSMPM